MYITQKTNQPIKFCIFISSYFEETNEGYALAKIITLKYSQHLKKKIKRIYFINASKFIWRGDNFDLKSSHVLPALIKKFTLAKIKNLPQVEVWGSEK